MRDDNKLIVQTDETSVVARSQKMAAALSSYARALTFENRTRRNLYRLAGLAPRRRDRVFSMLLLLIAVCMFVVPSLAGVVYYGFVASPGYTSEVRFIVRSSAPILSRDRYSSDTVEPKAKIVQDTAVLLNYLDSPSVVSDLQKNVNLLSVYGRADIDTFSRLRADATQDEVLKYWRKWYSASVNPKSGIVELEVTAFTAAEAQRLVQTVLRLAEEQVNRLSSSMWNDLLVSAQKDVESATGEVAELRSKLRDTQNQTGVFDVDMSAESNIAVLTGIEASIAQLKSRRAALALTLDKGAPQLSDMDRRIAALEVEAGNLGRKTAGLSEGNVGNLADFSSVFDKLKLDLKVTEAKLQSAIGELEKVKLVSSLQLVYVDNFTDPTLPEKSAYPNVALKLLLWILLWATLCGATSGAVILARNRMD